MFEGFVASEILKSQVNSGLRREIYHFRDQQGLEVDFVVPATDGRVWLIECKAAATVVPAMARPLKSLLDAVGVKTAGAFVVHPSGGPPTHALAPGASALDVAQLLTLLSARRVPGATPGVSPPKR